MKFIVDNWKYIATALGVLVAVATVVNRNLPRDASGYVKRPASWGAFAWMTLCDLLSLLPQPGKVSVLGPVSLPGLTSLSPPAALPVSLDGAEVVPRNKPGRAAEMLPFFFALTLGGMASGCAWAKCELGHLPQTAQALIATVVGIASNSDNYVDDLLDLGKQVGPAQLDCIVESLTANAVAPKPARAGEQPWAATVTDKLNTYLAVRRAQGARLECAPVKTADALASLP